MYIYNLLNVSVLFSVCRFSNWLTIGSQRVQTTEAALSNSLHLLIHFSLFSLSGSLSQLITSTPSNTTILAKSPTSNPAACSHTPAKEIEGNFRLNLDWGELTHLIFRVLTSFFLWGVRSTVLIILIL